MKFLSLAIVAFIACAAVAAAEPVDELSFDELAFGPIDSIKEKLKEFYKKFVCARDIIEKEIKGSGFEKDFEEFKKLVEDAKANLKKCAQESSKINEIKCAFNVLKELPATFEAFFEKLVKKDQELAKKIRDEIQSECFAKDDLFEDEDYASGVDAFQCIVDVLGDVSKKNGLEADWAHSQPILQRHIDGLKTCSSQQNKFLRFFCYIREGIGFFKAYYEYVQVVAQKNPAAIQDFIKQVQAKCTGAQAAEFGLKDKIKDIVNEIKCVKGAIDDAVKGTNFEAVFDKLKKDLEQTGEHLKACKKQAAHPKEALKCIFNELKAAKTRVADFLRALKAAEKGAFEQAKKNIQDRCHKH